jgi:hypothetical protein
LDINWQIIPREQQALLPIGGEAHVAVLQRERMRGGNRLFAQALHVERDFFLALRDEHAGVVSARLHHRAHPAPQKLGIELRRPGPDGSPVIIEDTHQAVRQATGFGRRHVDRGPRHFAGRREVQVGEIRLMSGPAGGLGNMEA